MTGRVTAASFVTLLTFNLRLRRHEKDCCAKKGKDGRSARPFPKAKVPEDGMSEQGANRLRPGWFQLRQEQQSFAAENPR